MYTHSDCVDPHTWVWWGVLAPTTSHLLALRPAITSSWTSSPPDPPSCLSSLSNRACACACRQLGVGPVAVTSLLIGNGVKNMLPGSEDIDNPSNPAPQYAALQAEYNHKVCGTDREGGQNTHTPAHTQGGGAAFPPLLLGIVDDFVCVCLLSSFVPHVLFWQHQVIQLAFLVACLYTGVGVLRLGFMVRFLSHSVITGFTSGVRGCLLSQGFRVTQGDREVSIMSATVDTPVPCSCSCNVAMEIQSCWRPSLFAFGTLTHMLAHLLWRCWAARCCHHHRHESSAIHPRVQGASH